MIKELLLAAFIGGILGLGVTGGYLTLKNKNLSTNQPIITEPTLVPTQTETNPNQEATQTIDGIQINSPENNSLLSTTKTNIIGITKPESHIIIATNDDSFVGQADDQGKFDIAIELDAGLNLVKISSIDSDGNQKDTEINITYSTAKI